jgi:hypothetical protein
MIRRALLLTAAVWALTDVRARNLPRRLMLRAEPDHRMRRRRAAQLATAAWPLVVPLS